MRPRCPLATNLFYMPASFAWRLTVALRPYGPSAPVRLRKPARRRRRRLQQNPCPKGTPLKAHTARRTAHSYSTNEAKKRYTQMGNLIPRPQISHQAEHRTFSPLCHPGLRPGISFENGKSVCHTTFTVILNLFQDPSESNLPQIAARRVLTRTIGNILTIGFI